LTPIALPSAIHLVNQVARELLDAHIPERDIAWIIKTALIVEALKRARGNTSRAARILGMERNSLNYQIGELHLEPIIADVKIAVEKQLTLFNRRKPSTPAHSQSTEFSTVGNARRA
jgi:hypothetical protein